MLRLALQTLTARKGGFVGTFVALLLGSAVLSVCGVLLESGLRASRPPERYASADVVVAGHQQARSSGGIRGATAALPQPLVERVPVPADVEGRITAVDGVAAVVADIGVPAQVIGPNGRPLPGAHGVPSTGHNWSGTRMGAYRLAQGRAPTGHREVVLDAGLAARARAAVGDSVSLTTGSAPERFRVAGVVVLPGNPSPRRSVVFFSDELTRAMAARDGAVDTLGVLADPGTDTRKLARDVARALGEPGLDVRTGDGRGEAEFLDVAASGSTLLLLASAVAGNVLLVNVFVVASTMSLAVSRRRRETALLRAVGATPGQVRRMLTVEALPVSLLGGALGWPLGVVVARALKDRLAGYGLVPADFQPSIGPLPAAAAVLTAVLTAYTAARVSARRANRIRPTEALGEAADERTAPGRGRLITGILLALAVAGMFATGLTQDGDVAVLTGLANSLVLVTVIAVAVLGPLLSPPAMRVLGPLLRTSRVTGYLAAANHTAHPRRLAAAVTPLILAVSFAATVVFAQTTVQRASEDQMHQGLRADHVLSAAGGLAPGVAAEVRGLKQVREATGVVTSTVIGMAGTDGAGREQLVSLSAQGVEPLRLDDVMDLKPSRGSLARLGADSVALSAGAASQLGRGPGDTVRLRLGDGTPVTATVVAVYERGLGFADVTFEHRMLLAHTTSRLDTSVLVRTAPGAVGTDAALKELARRHPGAVLQDRATSGPHRQQEANAWVNYLLAGLILAYAGVTVATTQAMNTTARRREFALLRLAGTTPAQVMRMMRWESLAVVVAGVGGGLLASAPALVLVSLAVTGSPWPTVPPLVFLAIAGATAALAALAALVPARIVLRTRPVEAIGTRQ
ncbi:FtsX-like permease family protein [Streptomyces sp. NPDC005813]|uniref:FtsX-like permease family protein n=1 Tax=Streptomyces sp. NPDC005813 TaxID=3155592 RepID=UPI0033FF1040